MFDYFRICPFCKVVDVRINIYGTGIIGCDCGVTISAALKDWEQLQQAVLRWNEKVAEIEQQKDVKK